MSLKKISATVLSLFTAISLHAHAAPAADIPCPPAWKIQWSYYLIDTAALEDINYAAITSKPAFNYMDKNWYLLISDIEAHSTEDALKIARDKAWKAEQKDKTAESMGSALYCRYTNNVIATTAFGLTRVG